MKAIIKNVLVAIVGTNLVACATTMTSSSIMPKGGDEYDLVATHAREDQAYKNAEKDANQVCKEKNKNFVAVTHKSEYQGVSKEEKQTVGFTDVAMAAVTGRSTKHDRSDDYKVTMHFKCQ